MSVILSVVIFHCSQLLLCLVCGAAAMLCKEHGATVFGVCLIYDVFIVNGDTVRK